MTTVSVVPSYFTGVFNPTSYGAKFDGITDDSIALQTAINAAQALPYGTVFIPYGVSCKINNGLFIDCSRLRIIEGNGAQLLCQGMTSGAAITINGTQTTTTDQNAQYAQIISIIRDLQIVGPGSTTSVDGILMVGGLPQSAAGPGGNYSRLSGLYISNFSNGIHATGPNTYLTSMKDVSCYYCNIGILVDNNGGGFVGENYHWDGGTIANGNHAVVLSAQTAELHMTGVSLDYNNSTIVRQLGTGNLFTFSGGHVEWNQNTVDAIFVTSTANNNMIRFSDSFISWTGTSTGMPVSQIVNNQTSTNAVVFGPGIQTTNLLTTSNIFGLGNVQWIPPNSNPSISFFPSVVSTTNSLLGDPSFETWGANVPSQPADFWSLRFDGSAASQATSQTVGTNLSIAATNTTSRSGTYCLQLTKITTTSGPCQFWVLAPVKPGQRVGIQYWQMTTSGSSSFGNAAVPTQLGYTVFTGTGQGNAIQAKGKQQVISGSTSILSTNWTVVNNPFGNNQLLPAPSWATHFFYLWDLGNVSTAGAVAYIDDMMITAF